MPKRQPRPERQAQQPNGLLEPYTVMLDHPVVVRARNLDEAVELAKGQVSKEAGDGE